MKLRHSAAAMVLACAVSATVGYGQQVTYSTPYTPGTPAIPGAVAFSESLTLAADAPLFIRPNGAGTELLPVAPSTLGSGAGYRYITSNFTVPNSGTYDLYSAQSFDGYLFLYSSPFDPSQPLNNVLAGDDDMTSLNGGSVPNRNGVSSTNDSGFRYDLNAGQNYTLVSSTWSASPTLNGGAIYNEIRSLPTPAVPADPIYSVPDDGTNTDFVTIDYVVPSGTTGTIASFNSLTLFNLTHTWVGDLVITLTHLESGRKVDILDRAGVDGVSTVGFDENLSGDYTFTDGGPELDLALATIPAGNYGLIPNGETGSSDGGSALSDFVGTNIAGTWRLTVSDWAAADLGTLSAFSFTVDLNSGTPNVIKGDFGGGESSDGSFNTPDGAFNELDVEGFLLALNDQASYLALNPSLAASLTGRGDFGGNESLNGSFNTPDGTFNELDVEGFLLALNDPTGYAAIQPPGIGGVSVIPEPAALGLLAPMGLLLTRPRRRG